MVSNLIGTTTVEAALYDYLTKQGDYDGPARYPFESVRLFDGMRINCRNDARRELRSRIGNRVYLDRRPQSAAADACLVMQVLSGAIETGLLGDEQCEEALIEITAYTSGADAARKAATICGLVQCAVGGYFDGYWGNIAIGECTVRPSRTLAQVPADAGDDWTFSRSMNLAVYYFSAVSPTFSEIVLQSLPTVRFDGSALRLNGVASTVANGRSIATFTWRLYTAASTTPVVQISGPAGAKPAQVGCTGTIIEPTVAVSNYPALQNTLVEVVLTVTDTMNATSVARVSVAT